LATHSQNSTEITRNGWKSAVSSSMHMLHGYLLPRLLLSSFILCLSGPFRAFFRYGTNAV
jgi:hypothetical protein